MLNKALKFALNRKIGHFTLNKQKAFRVLNLKKVAFEWLEWFVCNPIFRIHMLRKTTDSLNLCYL